MKKLLLIGIIATTFVGCGTMKETKTEIMTISSNQNIVVKGQDGEVLGEGKDIDVVVSNRATPKGREEYLIIENTATGETHRQDIEKEWNKWSHFNLVPPTSAIITYPIDFYNKGHKRNATDGYNVEFGEEVTSTPIIKGKEDKKKDREYHKVSKVEKI